MGTSRVYLQAFTPRPQYQTTVNGASATAALQGETLRIHAVEVGTATVQVTARNGTDAATARVSVVVSERPPITTTTSVQAFVSDTLLIRLDTLLRGATTSVAAQRLPGGTEVGVAVLSDGVLRLITPTSPGSAEVLVSGRQAGTVVENRLQVTVVGERFEPRAMSLVLTDTAEHRIRLDSLLGYVGPSLRSVTVTPLLNVKQHPHPDVAVFAFRASALGSRTFTVMGQGRTASASTSLTVTVQHPSGWDGCARPPVDRINALPFPSSSRVRFQFDFTSLTVSEAGTPDERRTWYRSQSTDEITSTRSCFFGDEDFTTTDRVRGTAESATVARGDSTTQAHTVDLVMERYPAVARGEMASGFGGYIQPKCAPLNWRFLPDRGDGTGLWQARCMVDGLSYEEQLTTSRTRGLETFHQTVQRDPLPASGYDRERTEVRLQRID